MSKSSELVVSGCSFTDYCSSMYSEKEYTSLGFKMIDVPWEIPNYKSWGEVLAEDLDLDVVNLGIKGSGNVSICKRATDYIIANHKKVKLCVIGLSEWQRIDNTLLDRAANHEIRYYENISEFAMSPVKHTHPLAHWEWVLFNKDFYSNKKGRSVGRFNGLYDNASRAVYSSLRSIYELQVVCKQFNIECIFFQMLRPVWESIFGIGTKGSIGDEYTLKKEKQLLESILENPYFDLIDKKYVVGWPFFEKLGGYNFFDQYIVKGHGTTLGLRPIPVTPKNGDKPYLRSGMDLHPSQKGHQLISDIVKKELNERNISIRL